MGTRFPPRCRLPSETSAQSPNEVAPPAAHEGGRGASGACRHISGGRWAGPVIVKGATRLPTVHTAANWTKGLGMRVRSIWVGIAAVGLLAGCSSTPVAAPVTSKVTTVVTSAVTATVVETTTESVTETVPGPTETIAGPTETIAGPTETVTKPAPPARTRTQVVKETATVTADPATVTADPVTVTADAPAGAGPAPAASGSSFPDGSYLIGKEMPAGNYTSVGATETCVWLIYDSAHNATGSGFGRVATLPANGYEFESSGCGTWTPA